MDDDAQIFSVVGSARRSGRWRVPASTRTLTLFGRCLIDLRQAETTAHELSFSCISAFAGVTFIVPEGAEVRPSGVAVLGSARSLVPVSDSPAHLPPISIDAVTILGRLRIRTTDEEPDEERRDSWRERRRARKAARRAEKQARRDDPPARPDAVPDDVVASVLVEPARRPVEPERPVVEPGRALVDVDDLRRSTRPGRPPISAPSTPSAADDDTPAPKLFDRPRVSAPTIDPEPVGSIDDHPTVFGADDQSPLEGLRVPDSVDGMAEPTDVVDDARS